jgi:hypothetical protein
VSDAEREHVAGLLQKAVGRGLITLDEFTARTDRALVAQTRGELNVVLADLPYMRNDDLATTAAEQPLVLRTGTGSVRQHGYWTVPGSITADCGMGNISIDFTRATCPHREVTLRATCGSGTITVVVPCGWRVVMVEAISRMGSVVNKATDPPRPDLAGTEGLRPGRHGPGQDPPPTRPRVGLDQIVESHAVGPCRPDMRLSYL